MKDMSDKEIKTVAVSACLLGENCRYNGKNCRNEKLIRWLSGKKVIPVCPEVAGGLPVPREPAEISGGDVITKDGRSVRTEYEKGAEAELQKIKKENADLVILMSGSPACGVNEIYDGTFSGKRIKGNGIFAAKLKSENRNVLDVKDLEELLDGDSDRSLSCQRSGV